MKRKLTKPQIKVLLGLASGMSEKPAYKSAYRDKTIEALEDREFVTVRDIDGELRITPNGLDFLAKNHPAK